MAIRILVLDDEPAINQILTRTLEGAGYEVDRRHDALRALDTVEGAHFDLVITNSLMRGFTGANLVTRLRERYPSLPVLHLDDQSNPPTTDFPADVPTLNKPFGDGALLQHVRNLVGS